MDDFEEGNAALDKLKEMGIEGALYEHQAAFTVQEQSKALTGVSGEKTKNLFLKVHEKRARLSLCFPETELVVC